MWREAVGDLFQWSPSAMYFRPMTHNLVTIPGTGPVKQDQGQGRGRGQGHDPNGASYLAWFYTTIVLISCYKPPSGSYMIHAYNYPTDHRYGIRFTLSLSSMTLSNSIRPSMNSWNAEEGWSSHKRLFTWNMTFFQYRIKHWWHLISQKVGDLEAEYIFEDSVHLSFKPLPV